MSENNNEDSIVPALLEPGEPLISEELANQYKDFVASLVEESETKVAEEVKDDNVITGKTKGSAPVEVKAMDVVENGVIGSTTKKVAPKKAEPSKPKKDVETVAVFSSKSVNWAGVGKINRGYNILEKSVAEKWLSRWHCRHATPEEVAKEYNA